MVLGLFLSGMFVDLLTLIFMWPFKEFDKNKKMKKGVSIIIPAYNEELNIEKVINCAFDQTHRPDRVIVIDDNSKDKTYEICRELRKKHKNLTVIGNKINRGKSKNINHVLNN